MSAQPLFSWHLHLFHRIDVEHRPVRFYRPRRLVVLACLRTKRPGAGTLPAGERYNGPLWQTLRTVDPHRQRAQVAFVSARYGFRQADTPIEDYNARLTQDLASAMIAGGMTTPLASAED